MPFFDQVEMLPDDPIMHLPILFQADKNPRKVNLGIGSYKNEKGEPVVFSAIQEAERMLIEKHLHKEYPPIEGIPSFIHQSLKLIFGESLYEKFADNLFAEQTVGGTSALRVAGEFLSRHSSNQIFLPNPTWTNHKLIFPYAHMQVHEYPYYDPHTHGICFSELLQSIKAMPPKSVILLHASCHNPTGVDPTKEQWHILSKQIKEKQLIPLFDLSYQGFGHGIEEDAFSIRLFAAEGHPMFIASSNAKNFGLYGERVGLLATFNVNPDTIKKIRSHLKQIARSCYSVPPIHGARLVAAVLESPLLKANWMEELNRIRDRLQEMRTSFVDRLIAKGIKKDLSFLKNQLGLFSYTDLDSSQVTYLRQEYGIYLAEQGRVNVAGLNSANMDYVINAFSKILQ